MFPQKLRDSRIEKGDNQKDVANYLGITINAYRKYEYGEREPSFAFLIKLCEYFNVSADYLLGLSDIKERR